MSATITQRVSRLERQIRAEAKQKLAAEVEAGFAPAFALAANDPKILQSLKEQRAAVIKSKAAETENQALESFLQRASPNMSAQEFFFPRKVKLDATGNQVADDATGHVAVLLPAFGLQFDAGKPALAKNWAEAKKLAAAVRTFGAEDWTLPEVHELQLLIDRKRREPAIDTTYFPATPTDYWYHTATELVSADKKSPSDYAFYVYFGNGAVGWLNQGNSGFVRACRRVPASQ